jgi:UTP-glucose-1-phosphate uridylyltransferase
MRQSRNAVDEAREAGIEHFVFVTGRNKGVIEDHFDRQFELEHTLELRGRTEALRELQKDLPSAGRTSFTRQQEPLGLGHAVWCARELVGNQPFALLLPDMIFRAKPGVLKQMMQTYEETGGNIIGVEEVDPKDTASYGIVVRGDGLSATPAWWKSRSPRMHPRTCSSPAATSSSPGSSRCSPSSCAARVARSSSPTPCRR